LSFHAVGILLTNLLETSGAARVPVFDGVAILIPVFNEADVLERCFARLLVSLNKIQEPWRVYFVDDGSTDVSWRAICTLSEDNAKVYGLRLSRNFGKEAALTAGLDHINADAVIVMDADLQDPPELIVEFIAHWRAGFDVVYGRRSSRKGESWLKQMTARYFYAAMAHLGDTQLPRDTGDFRLLSRRACEKLAQLRERNRFMKGLFAWIGLPQKAVDFVREPRVGVQSKWNYWRLWNFALDGITAFSTLPLRISTYLGALTALFAFGFGGFILLRTLIQGVDLPGYASLIVTVMFLGGVQLMVLGIIGEYLGRLFYEAKQRPIYLIQEQSRPMPAADSPAKSSS
jgi:polyisoprenyl-phosphate glycosyltransferase